MNDSAGRHHGATGPTAGDAGDTGDGAPPGVGPGRGGHSGLVGTEEIPPGGIFGLRVLPAGWMRGVVVTVTVLVTLVVAMGDLASAWVLLLLPLTVAALTAYAEVLERTLNPVGRESGARESRA